MRLSDHERPLQGAAGGLAEMLSGSWRADETHQAAGAVAPGVIRLALASQTAPLVARKLGSAAPQEIIDAYRLARLEHRRREQRLAAITRFFTDRGVAILIGKGAVAAACYADPATRMSSDTDLYVDPADAHRVTALLPSVPDSCGRVDIHLGAPELDDLPWPQVAARQRTIDIGGTPVPAFSPSDHLRLLCVHFLKHGGFRPGWLCDIAALVEREAAQIDWDLLRTGAEWRARWVPVLLALARDLLGAGLPMQLPAPPAWIAHAVLRRWEDIYNWPHNKPTMAAVALRAPWRLPVELWRRRIDPITASYLRAIPPRRRQPRFAQATTSLGVIADLPRQLSAMAGWADRTRT